MKSKRSQPSLRRPYVSIGLWVLSAVGMAMSLIILFQAGCARDVKTIALGDVRRALQLEGYGIGAALVSAGLRAAAFIQISQSPRRVPQAITFALFLFACL